MMGGKLAHEYHVPDPDRRGHAAPVRRAAATRPTARWPRFGKPAGGARKHPLPLEKVATPRHAQTIADLAALPRHRAPARRPRRSSWSATVPERPADVPSSFIFAVVRGDMEVNETKLANARQGAASLRPATEEEIRGGRRRAGLRLAGRAARMCWWWSTTPCPRSPNLVAGANEAGYHLLNVNYGRDYHRRRSWPTWPPRAKATPARSAARRCAPRAASRWATSSSWARATATRWAAPSSDADGQDQAGDHGLVRHRRRPAAGLHRRGAPRRARA